MHIHPDPYVMAFVFVVFMATLLLLNKFVFSKMVSFMDERDSKIRHDLAMANKDDMEVMEVESKIESCLNDARRQAKDIIEAEIREATKNANARIEQIRSENKARLEAYMENLENERGRLKESLKKELADSSLVLVSKIRGI